MATRSNKKLFTLLLATILIIGSTIAYKPGALENTSGDTISNRYFPVSILKHQTYLLNPFKKDLKGVDFAAIFDSGGDWIPRSYWGMLVFTVPFYFFADIVNLGGKEWTHDRVSVVSRYNAIFLAVTAVVLLFQLLIKFVSPMAAFGAAALFAFGGWNWSLGAQGLTNQTVGVLLVTIGMHWSWKLSNDKKATAWKWGFFLGLLLGLLWAARSPDIFLLLPMLLQLRNPKQFFACIGSTVLLVAPLTIIYINIYGDPLGWQGLLARLSPGMPVYRLNFLPGLAGLLVSPNRGAIVFFPLLLLIPFFWWKLLPKVEFLRTVKTVLKFRIPKLGKKVERGIPQAFSQVLALSCILYFASLCFLDWWHSTWSFGPRYLYNFQPCLWPAVALAIHSLINRTAHQQAKLPTWSYALLIIFAIQGIGVHWLGQRNFDIYVWNYKKRFVEARAWHFNDFMLVDVWKVGPTEGRWPGALERLKSHGY